VPEKLDVNAIPGWLLWLCLVAALAVFFAAVLRVIPPAKRAWVARRLPICLLVLVPAALSARNHFPLLLGAAVFLPASIPLFWYGPMPSDMPLSTDPQVSRHTRYAEFVRRGKIAGFLIVGWIVALVVLVMVFVRVD
jgi:hypothetical protein